MAVIKKNAEKSEVFVIIDKSEYPRKTVIFNLRISVLMGKS